MNSRIISENPKDEDGALELEKLNTATTEINSLELELDESNTTFRMLLNEATRRLKALGAKLGSSVDKARPYHEAATQAQAARTACQRAAVNYQRAQEIHAAAKETVLLAEQRFKSNQHEWQFDNAWQEMLNHATIKVMDAENQKAESGREHYKRAQLFNAAETKVVQLEEQYRKHIIKSRLYFEEKQLCQEQLSTQKARIEALQESVARAKLRYAGALRALEGISEEIHRKRKEQLQDEWPVGPREPGVGAERDNYTDYSLELERNDLALRNPTIEESDVEVGGSEEEHLEELRRHVRRLAARPVEGGAQGDHAWESELNDTVNRLDRMLMLREHARSAGKDNMRQNSPETSVSAPNPSTPHQKSSPPHQTSSSGKQAFQTLYGFNKSEATTPQHQFSSDPFKEQKNAFEPFVPEQDSIKTVVSLPVKEKIQIQELSIDNLKLACSQMSSESGDHPTVYIPGKQDLVLDQAGGSKETFNMDSPDFSYDIRFDNDFGKQPLTGLQAEIEGFSDDVARDEVVESLNDVEISAELPDFKTLLSKDSNAAENVKCVVQNEECTEVQKN